ncbi:MAG: PAS domain S-box protein [Rhodobacteraceae bacterium]|nr:PAS domain S-box protein [Paracoccaceae bacterium]
MSDPQSEHEEGADHLAGLLLAGSEASALIHAHDWSASPLGSPARWPRALTTVVGLMLGSRQPMFVAWGPSRTILYNDGYAPMCGKRHPKAFGQPFAEVWAEIMDDVGPILERAFAGESTHRDDIALTMERNGFPEETHFAFSYTPVRGDDGRVAGMLCACSETTERVKADRRQAFLLKLSDAVRQLADPEEIKHAAAGLVGAHLGANRVGYAEDAGDGETVVVTRTYAEGVPDVAGRFRYRDFGPDLLPGFQAGKTVVRNDVAADPALTAADKAAHAALQIAARLDVPLLKAGRLTAVFFTHFDKPHAFTPEEVALLEAVAERTWSSVARARAETALRDSEARLRHILDSATEYAIVTLASDRSIVSWNSGAERLLGYTEAEALGRPADILFTEADCAAGAPEAEMRTVREEGRALDERWRQRKDGSRFWGSGVMLPMENESSGLFLKIFRDRTEERQAEEHRRLLVLELNHRVKNTLATVQAMATQTFREGETLAEAKSSFWLRLRALSDAHDVLTSESWARADFRQIVETALAPFVTAAGARIRVEGPSFFVTPRAALAAAMTVHELATNATKFGALSGEAGRIVASWAIEPGEGAGGDRFRFTWTERGGPHVAPPTRKGFGSQLIERSVAGEFGGAARIDYAPEGLVCEFDAPLARLRQDQAG